MNYAIIAAGEGSRLVSEGVPVPKPLVDLDGRPMIGRLIDIMCECGAESVSVIVNEGMTQVADYLRERARTMTVPLRLTVRTTPSSMHSFYELVRLIPEGKFVLTTVDTIFDAEAFRRYAEAFAAAPAGTGHMGVTDYIDDEKPLYVGTAADNRITGFYDTPHPDARYISAGIYGLERAVALPVLESCMAAGVHRMRNYQRQLMLAGVPLQAVPLGRVFDVDHASDIAAARSFLSNPHTPDHA